MRAVIDTCIIIDALQSRDPWRIEAEEIFLQAADRTFEGYITAKSLLDIYYLLHKDNHSDSLTRKMLTHLCRVFEIADTTGFCCKDALVSETQDYEDAVQIQTAIALQADCIVTRNTHDFSRAKIPVHTPVQFLNLIVS